MNATLHRTMARDHYRRRNWPLRQEHHCALCGQAGHNRRSCTRGALLDETEPARVPMGDECRPDRPADMD